MLAKKIIALGFTILIATGSIDILMIDKSKTLHLIMELGLYGLLLGIILYPIEYYLKNKR